MRLVLKASGISKADTDMNPQAVLDVLNFHMEGPIAPRQMPSRASVARSFTEVLTIKNDDYTKYYGSMKKLGQGASGILFSLSYCFDKTLHAFS